MGEGECQDFPSKISCLTVPKSIVGQPCVLFFRNLPVAKMFLDKREREESRFPSKIFCLTVPKNFVGEPFSLSLVSCIRKTWMSGWEVGVAVFSIENFLSHSAENFRRVTI